MREAMNPKPIEQARTRELALALPAFRRARQRAEEIEAAQDSAGLCVVDDEFLTTGPLSQVPVRSA